MVKRQNLHFSVARCIKTEYQKYTRIHHFYSNSQHNCKKVLRDANTARWL